MELIAADPGVATGLPGGSASGVPGPGGTENPGACRTFFAGGGPTIPGTGGPGPWPSHTGGASGGPGLPGVAEGPSPGLPGAHGGAGTFLRWPEGTAVPGAGVKLKKIVIKSFDSITLQ